MQILNIIFTIVAIIANAAVTYFAIKYFVLGTKWYIDSMKKIWKNGI